MKAISTLALLAFLSSVARADATDDALLQLTVAMTRDGDIRPALHDPRCVAELRTVRELGAPASRTIRIDRATPFLAVGNHALPAVRKACDAQARANRLAMAKETLYEALNRSRHEECVQLWPAIVSAGVDTQTRAEFQRSVTSGVQETVSGTLEELKTKYCDGALADRAAAQNAKEAPYRKVLVNDKVAIYFDRGRRGDGIALRDGDKSETPAKLAKARTWFAWAAVRPCTDGRTKYIVHRYDFDAKQTITNESVSEHCGELVFK